MRLGELLVELGRITHSDVADALVHQREHGGYLGDALIQRGVITRDELRWTLAAQHDLPYVRLRPDSIDHGLAARVPASWAREHHMVPVLLVDGEVTVVLGDIADLEKLEEIRVLTGAATVEPALSSPEEIRALIDAVFGPVTEPTTRLSQLLEEARASGARTLGVSVRDGFAVGWYRVVESIHRPLLPGWEEDLADALSPGIDPAGARSWPALLRLGAESWRVECDTLSYGGALEWAARLVSPVPAGVESALLDPDLDAEIRRGLAHGPLLVGVVGDQGADDVLGAALPLLPRLLFGRGARSFHLVDRGLAAPASTLTVPVRDTIAAAAESLAVFSPQAITMDVARLAAADEPGVRGAAPLVCVYARDESPRDIHLDLSIGLRLDEAGFVWTLQGCEHGAD